MKKQQPLSDAQLAAIAWADNAESTPALARRLDAPYDTLIKARRRFRQSPYGWHCRLQIVTCRHCGEPLLCGTARSHARLVHRACQPAHLNARQRARRAAGNLPPSTPYVEAWRARNPERSAELREQEKLRQREQWPSLAPEEQDAALERAHAADARDFEATRDRATQSGVPWTDDDDTVIIARINDPARDVALALGRSLWAVRNRRVTLRKHGLLDQHSRAGGRRAKPR